MTNDERNPKSEFRSARQARFSNHSSLIRHSILLVLFAAAVCSAAESPKPSSHPSLKAASEAAAAEDSLVLLIFGADWCAPCHQLKKQTLGSPEFQKQAGALHIAEVDIDADEKTARAFGINAVPTLVLLTADNKIIQRRTGFVPTDELLLWLQEGRTRAKEGKWEGTTPGSKVQELVTKAGGDGLDTNDIVKLVAILSDPDPAERASAGKLIVAQREQAVGPLIEAMTNSYLGVRIAAMELLHELAPRTAHLDPWQSPMELGGAINSLRKWWAESGKLPSPSPERRTPDAGTIGSLKNAFDSLRSDDPVQRTKAMSTIVSHGEASLPGVREAIKRAERSGDQRSLPLLEDIRWSILVPDALEQSSSARKSLARGKGQERQAAASRLGRAGPGAIPALAELANDVDPLVVESAVRALSTIGGKDTIPAMAALLKAADSNLRMTAAQALGKTKNSEALNPLLSVLDDPNEVVTCTALSALEEVSGGSSYSQNKKALSPELIAGLKTTLADPRWRVRAAAAEVAGKLQAKDLVAELKRLLEDADGFVIKSALEALRSLSSVPESDTLAAIARRQPGLRGEALEMLVSGGPEEALRPVTEMYNAGSTETRLAILQSLDQGGRRDQGRSISSSTVFIQSLGAGTGPDAAGSVTSWQPLLTRAAAETDPRLRRAVAGILGAQPARVAAAIVGPLLSDQDAETRAAAAGVVLSVISGERVAAKSRHGRAAWLSESFDDSNFGLVGSNKKQAKTNQPPATTEQIAAWHAALQQHAGAAPDPVSAAAIYATGDTNRDLPLLQAAFERADKTAIERVVKSAALAAVMPRLPWPEARSLLDRFCATPALFVHALAYVEKLRQEAGGYLLEPARFRAAVETGSATDLDHAVERLLAPDQRNWSLLSTRPGTEAVVFSLLDSTNAVWRAAAVYSLTQRGEQKQLEYLERAAKDSNSWVRATAVRGLARASKDREPLEARLGPLLADADTRVAQRAAIGLLEPETRAAANWEYLFESFEFEKVHAYGSFNSANDQRPLTVIETKPALLEHARQNLQSAKPEDAAPFALLLAQYGDFSGVDRLLDAAKTDDEAHGQHAGPALAAIALSHDAKYVPYLRKVTAAAKQEWDYKKLLQAIKGISGTEARELRLEINKRLREGVRNGSE